MYPRKEIFGYEEFPYKGLQVPFPYIALYHNEFEELQKNFLKLECLIYFKNLLSS